MIELSVISLTYNSAHYLKQMLDSLIKELSTIDKCEIIIIDNGSNDSTIEIIKSYEKDLPNNSSLCCIPLSRNMGTTFSRNIGIKMSSGQYILILDSDTEMFTGSIASLVEQYKKYEREGNAIGILHPRLLNPNGTFQESARRFPTILTKFYRLFNIEFLRNKDESIENVLLGKPCEVEYAISAAWLLSRSVFEKVGLFDEKIFYAPEDAEYCFRCRSHGYRILYYPSISITHHSQRLSRKKGNWNIKFQHLKGLFYFWQKTSCWIKRPIQIEHQIKITE